MYKIAILKIIEELFTFQLIFHILHAMKKWIMHIDMDAFFASVEELDDPSLRGKAVIVGANTERGVVCSASYIARKFGIRSAMPAWQARKLCPNAIFIKPHKKKYAEVSKKVMNIFNDFSPIVEKASIDEAYLDVSGLDHIFNSVEDLALEIKNRVKENLGLTCSIGLAPIKFLAKIASDINKPDGLYIIKHENIEQFLYNLPIKKIPSVGHKLQENLNNLGIIKVCDILRYPKSFFENRFGKTGIILYERAHGIDPRPVEPYVEPKSESAENTLMENTSDYNILKKWLLLQAETIGSSLRKKNLAGRTITIKIKYADFKQITRSHSLVNATNSSKNIFEIAIELLNKAPLKNAVRLIGISVSNFASMDIQLSLIPNNNEKEKALEYALDNIRERFGDNSITRGSLLNLKASLN